MNFSRVLVLGASGMLGNAVLRFFAQSPGYEVYGTARGSASIRDLQLKAPTARLITGIDVNSLDRLTGLFATVKPTLIINCVGIVKQLEEVNNPLEVLPINAMLPHRLAFLAQISGARLIHVSTDCVFSGTKGNYLESDTPDAYDLYGRSKLMGEVDYPNAITLRTSIIGRELSGTRSLIDWFLSQRNAVCGYKKAVFSGFPTVEIARIIRDFVVPNPYLHGLYHLSAEPISKYDLLSLVAQTYNKEISINPNESYVIDRSLNSDRFKLATGFKPEPWVELVKRMHTFN